MLRTHFLPALGCLLISGCGCQPFSLSSGQVQLETQTDSSRQPSVAESSTDQNPSQPSPQADETNSHVATDSHDPKPGSTPTEVSPTEAVDNGGSIKLPTGASDKVEVISFDDLNIGMPVDAKFREVMLTINDGRVLDLKGRRVNVAGYMNATDTLKGVKEFILLRNLECKFGPGGQADHLVHVVLQGDLETEFTDKVVYVEGVLRINPFPQDGPSTWSIYDIEATKVSTRPPPRGS